MSKAIAQKKLVLDRHFILNEKEARKFNTLKKKYEARTDIEMFRMFLKNF